MKRLIITVLYIFPLMVHSLNAATVLRLESATADPGDTATIALSLYNSDAVGGLQFIITPDPARGVSFLQVSAVGRAQGWEVSYNPSGDGLLVVVYSSSAAAIEPGEGSILSFKYGITREGTPPGQVQLCLEDLRVSDDQLNNVADLAAHCGWITVRGELIQASLSLGDEPAAPGQTVQLGLELSNSAAVAGFQFLVAPATAGVLTLTQVETLGRAADWEVSYNQLGSWTKVVVYSSSAATIPAGQDAVLALTYQVAAGAPAGDVRIELSEVEVSDALLNPAQILTANYGFIAVQGANPASNTLVFDRLPALRGDEAQLTLTLNNTVALSGFQFVVTPYPEEAVTLVEAAAAGRAADWDVSSNLLGDGLAVVVFSQTGESLDPGQGAVLTLNCRVADNAPAGNVWLLVSELKVSDAELNPVTDLSVERGALTVAAGELPGVYEISPSYVYQGAKDLVLEVAGEKFTEDCQVAVSGGGFLVQRTEFVDTEHLRATISISTGTAPGLRDVTVTKADGMHGVGRDLLEVRGMPEVFEIKPFYLVQGTDSLLLTINGKDFSAEASAVFPEGGINVLGLEYIGSSQLLARVSVDRGASPGRRKLDLTVAGFLVSRQNAVEIKANLPPQIFLPENWTVKEGDYLSFQVEGTDPEGGPLVFKAENLPQGASFRGTSFSWTPPFDAEGEYTIRFTVADKLGLTDDGQVVIKVINRNRPPVFLGLTDHKVAADEQMAFNIIASDADGDPLGLSVEGLPVGASLTGMSDSSFAFSWTPVSENMGSFRTTFTVSDPYGGTDRRSLALTVEIPEKPVNLPPAFKDFPSVLEIKEGEYFELTLQAEDPNQDPVAIFTKGLPKNADFDPTIGRLTFRPDYTQSGSYQLLFLATDGSLSTSTQQTVLVMDEDAVPVLFGIEALVVAEGEQLSVVFAAVDSGGDVLRFGADDLPRGAYLDPSSGNFLFTPDYNQAGDYSFRVWAMDPAGQSAESGVSLRVNNVNRKPVLDFIPSQVAEPGMTLEFLVSAIDPDGDLLSYTFFSEVLPENAFNPQTQVFKFTASGQAGVFEGLMIAADSYGAADSQAVVINVSTKANEPPVVEAVAEQFLVEGDTLVLPLSATDPEGKALTYSVFNREQLPPAMREISQQGIFTLSSGYESAGRYKVIFQVSDGEIATQVPVILNIANRNRAPLLDPVGELQVAEGEKLELKITARDPDGDAINYAASGLPRWASFDKKQGIFSFRPDFDQADTITLGVSVSDGYLTATDNFKLVIQNTNRPPLLRQVRDPRISEGGILEFEMEADDPDGDSVWVVVDKSRMPFLGEAVRKAAEIRNGRSFLFDTDNLIKELQIPSAVIKFYAQDKYGAVSQEQTVDMTVIRQLVEKVLSLPPGEQQSFDWSGVGVSLEINNNSQQNYACDINVAEHSGQFRTQLRPLLQEDLQFALAGAEKKKAWLDRYRYTYLSASGEEREFYGIRRGWSLELCRPSAETKITVVMKYFNEDMLEVEDFKEEDLDLYGLDQETGQFIRMEQAVIDTADNSVTFEVENIALVDYTLGAELTPPAGEPALKVELVIAGEVLEEPVTSDTEGPYTVRAITPETALVTDAVLYFRLDTLSSYRSGRMEKVPGLPNAYAGDIPALSAKGTIQYYVQMIVDFETMTSPLNPLASPYRLQVVSKFIPGDSTGDGVINIFDLLSVLKELAGGTEFSPASDVNGDGAVNIFDLLALLQILAGP